MKNIKMTEELKTRIVSGGLSLVLVAAGFGLGKLDSNNNNLSEPSNISIVSSDELVKESLNDYIAKRDKLEKEINSLLEQKEELQNTEKLDVMSLVVMENTNVKGESNLYIVYPSGTGGIFKEYHNEFEAWYGLHSDSEEHNRDFCPLFIHFYEYQHLFNYLTDEEIEALASTGGQITISELDEILIRIRSEYQEQLSKKNHSRNLTNN